VPRLILHADNCSGQNKNNSVLRYLLWRIIMGFNDTIAYFFMVAGHTKNEVDGLFGCIKRNLYRQQEVITPAQLVEVTKHSITSSNITVTRGRDMLWFDWASFLDQFFVRFYGIFSKHVLYFSREHPTGIMAVDDVGHMVSNDDYTELLKPGVSLEAVVNPAAHGLRPLSDFVLGHLPLNVDRHKQLTYDIHALIEGRNKELGIAFRRALGTHPLCPIHPTQRRFWSGQLELFRQLRVAEQDEEKLAALKVSLPRRPANPPYPQPRLLTDVLGLGDVDANT